MSLSVHSVKVEPVVVHLPLKNAFAFLCLKVFLKNIQTLLYSTLQTSKISICFALQKNVVRAAEVVAEVAAEVATIVVKVAKLLLLLHHQICTLFDKDENN